MVERQEKAKIKFKAYLNPEETEPNEEKRAKKRNTVIKEENSNQE
jgi:hypothetical protein